MRKNLRGKRGAAFVWLSALMAIFMVGLLYLVMTQPYMTVYDYVDARVNSTDYDTTFTQIRTYWRAWPLLVLAGLIMWAFIATMRKDPNEYYR